MDTINLEECLKVAISAARESGKLIQDAWGKAASIEAKLTYADLVTSTDKESERLLFSIIRSKFPNHKFIGEESTSEAANTEGGSKLEITEAPTWIIDPVDGTMNFVHACPFVAVSIGLTIAKKPVLGVVYAPMLDKMYTAQIGKGAFCNNQPIQVSKVSSLKEALVCIEMGAHRDEEKRECTFKNLDSVGWKCHGIRALGSAAIDGCYVAAGHFNAFYEFGLWPWDMCAAAIIIQEAGGYVCDTTGGKFDMTKRRWIAASSESLAKEIAANLPIQMELSCN